MTTISTDKIEKDTETKGGCVMSRRFHHATLLIFAVGILVPAGLAAQDVVYTGCIKSADGTLYSVRQGTTPIAPCKAKDKQISWNMAGQPGPPGPPGPSLPPTLWIGVNCAEGQSINAALAQQAERLNISISGTCVEEVAINRDDVALFGVVGTNPTIMAPAGASSAVVLEGAQRVYLQDLAVTATGGSWVTLLARDGASFTAHQMKVSNPTGIGLLVTDGANAVIRYSEISACQQSGASVGNGSSLYLEGCQVIENGDWGLFVEASNLSLAGTNVARNLSGVGVRNSRVMMSNSTILDNSGPGVRLGFGQLFLSACRIAANVDGIQVIEGSSAILDEVIIQGNGGDGVSVDRGSSVKVGPASTIDGGAGSPGIRLWDTSVASVEVESSITGSPYGIECSLPPSVAQLRGPVPDGLVTNCPISY